MFRERYYNYNNEEAKELKYNKDDTDYLYDVITGENNDSGITTCTNIKTKKAIASRILEYMADYYLRTGKVISFNPESSTFSFSRELSINVNLDDSEVGAEAGHESRSDLNISLFEKDGYFINILSEGEINDVFSKINDSHDKDAKILEKIKCLIEGRKRSERDNEATRFSRKEHGHFYGSKFSDRGYDDIELGEGHLDFEQLYHGKIHPALLSKLMSHLEESCDISVLAQT